jgi:hypothetical protein
MGKNRGKNRNSMEGEKMIEKLHRALEAIVPHVQEGSRVFVLDGGCYHKFRVEEGRVAHTETHSVRHVENGRGPLSASLPRTEDIK